MKTILIILGIAIGIGLVIALVAGFSNNANTNSKVAGYKAGDPNAPKLELQEKRYDFGKISVKDEVKYEFKLKNTGKSPLVVTNLITSCHCTSAILKVDGKPASPEFDMHANPNWSAEVAPEKEAVVEVIYAPSKMPVSGQVSRVITFNTNDPTNKEIQLEIFANVSQ